MLSLNSIEHIIWDWNGTLVDDLQLCVKVINRILNQRDLPRITVQQYKETFDFPVINYYQRLGFDLENDSFEGLSDEFVSAYESERRSLSLHSGAIEALQFFQLNDIPQCMLSATKIDLLLSTLREHGIAPFFKSVLGLDHHYAHGKIHLGNTWMKNNHLEKENVLFIGDTLHDLKVAKAMGINCILVVTGHNSEKRLKAHHSEVMNNLHEVLERFNTN